MRRIVVTGVGLITSLGTGTEASWQGLIEGRTGIGPVSGFNPSSLRTQVCGEVPDFEPKQFVQNRRALRMMTRNDQFALAGATLAVRDAGVEFSEDGAERAGLFVGSNKEISNPLQMIEATLVARNPDGTVDMHKLGESAPSTMYPLFYIEGLQAASLFYISEAFKLKGANTYFAGTAESGAVAVGRAFRAIRRGESDIALAGGFDDAVSWWNMTKFDALGIMTGRNELGPAACRPFDRDRSGTVLGEGASFLLLEELEAATERGARIYAEVTGFGSAYDTYKYLTPDPEGKALSRAMESALEEAGSSPGDVGYVVAHGSATRKGDASEARAIQTVFGNGTNGTAGSGVKAATGHMIAGAGALNAAVAALALHHQVAPPTLNLENLDPECEFNWIAGQARELHTDGALALARGLEGQNVALAMRAVR